jgi:uncharacterized protein (DUF2267 family)
MGMSATGLEVFDRTVQLTNIWLNEIMAELGPDRHFGWHVLGAVLRCLRDQLPPEMAAHLGAQLPLLVRGTYYDGWRGLAEPGSERSADAFLDRVATGLATTRPVAPRAAVLTVLGVLSRHIDRGQVMKVRDCLPKDIRRLWPETLLEAAKPQGERERQIRERAYAIWELESRPHGLDREHWLRAASEIDSAAATTSRAASKAPGSGSRDAAEPDQSPRSGKGDAPKRRPARLRGESTGIRAAAPGRGGKAPALRNPRD